jgi:hypothetical protein
MTEQEQKVYGCFPPVAPKPAVDTWVRMSFGFTKPDGGSATDRSHQTR